MPIATGAAAYDLYFPGENLGLMLVRDQQGRAVGGSFGPSEATDRHDTRQNRYFPTQPKKDVPRIWHDWSAGGGHTLALEETEGGFAWAEDLVTRIPGVVIPSGARTEVVVNIPAATPGACTASYELDNNLYFVCGRYVIPIANGTDAGPIVLAEKDFGVGITAGDAVLFDNAVCVGTSDTLWRKPAGGAWSQTDPDTGIKTLVSVLKLGTVYWEADDPSTSTFVGKQRLVGRLNSNNKAIEHMSAPNNPLRAAAWSGPITIGNGSYPINSFAGGNRHIYSCTSGGVADLDARGYSPIMNPWVQQHRDDTLNGRVSLFYAGRVFSSHVQGLVMEDVGSDTRHDEAVWCQPGAGLANETPVSGQITAMTTEGGFIVASVFNGTDSYVCYARPNRSNSGENPLTWWTGEHVIRGEQITHLRATSPSGGGLPRLWICSTVNGTGALKIRWAPLAKAATIVQELLNNLDSNGNYSGSFQWNTAGSLYFTNEDWDDNSAKKVLLRHDVRGDRLGPATYLRVYARAENGPWVQQGDGADPKATRSPRSEILPIAPLTQGFDIQLRVDFVGTATAPALLRQFKSRAQVIQESRESVDYVVVLAARQSLRNGARGQRGVRTILRQIQRLQVREPILLRDELFQERTVRVESTQQRRELLHWAEGQAKGEVVIALTMTVSQVPASASDLTLDSGSSETPPVTSGSPFIWDQSFWDSGDVWAS